MTRHIDDEIELMINEFTGWGFACMHLQVHPRPTPPPRNGKSHFFNPSFSAGKFRTEDTYLPSERMYGRI